MTINESSITTREAVIQFLQSKHGTQFKSREVANELKKLFNVKYGNKSAGQLAAEISAGIPNWLESNPQLRKSDETPRTFWWDETQVSAQVESAASTQSNNNSANIAEHELYPLLAKFLFNLPRKIYSKRIDEKRSSNSNGHNGNKWLHPDLVGMEDLTSEWFYEMKDWTSKIGTRKAKLWSFEVKLEIKKSSVRPYYFQAVSNSTWANIGYLVAAKISPDALPELRLLNELHGIGVIELDVDDPIGSSQIPIPARERSDVDWGMCNRIAAENRDFKDYIQLVAQLYNNHSTNESQWDIPKVAVTEQ